MICLLKFCDENDLYVIDYLQYINIICVIVLLISFFLTVYLIKNKFLRKKTRKHYKKIFLVLVVSVLFVLVFLMAYFTYKAKAFEGCMCKIEKTNHLVKNNSKQLKRNLNKIIIVGDSRMEYIVDGRHGKVAVPKNYIFIAKSGTTIDWFKDFALRQLENKLDNRNKKYNYYVVINMGVNDINYIEDVRKRSSEYFEYYKKMALKYPTVTFYIMSVNPISDEIINNFFPTNKRSNKKIEAFNKKTINLIEEFNYPYLKYCDAYHDLYFKTIDGLHYKGETSQKIINYISNGCIDFK